MRRATLAVDDQDLWKSVDDLFTRRPCWSLQAMSRPGAPPVWCLGQPTEPDLTVTVNNGEIQATATKTDTEFVFTTIGELTAWLHESWPGSLPDRPEPPPGSGKWWRHRFRWN
jgi:hypothetical protein